MTLINGPLEAIEEMDIKDQKLNKNLKVIGQNTKRLLDLTGQLLDFQKIGASKFELKFETVDVTALLNETITRFEPTILQKQKELLQHIPQERIMAAIDKEAITKVLSNLLNNALKYARHTIMIDLFQDGADFTVRVVSDGEKIPEASSQQIFEPFYQVEKKKDTVRMGVGIGLPLARSLATLHKGRLYLDIEQPENTFVLTIPLNKEEVRQQIEKVVEQNIEVLDEETSTETDQMKGYTLLLVEDNESMRSFIFERLEALFTVETAVNGQEALDILRSNHIDLVISDIMMPKVDGLELCRRIKHNVQTSHIPVILLTARSGDEAKISGYAVGADSYISKPFSFDVLLVRIKQLIEQQEGRKKEFRKTLRVNPSRITITSIDEQLLQKALKLIEEHIDNSEYNVEQLSTDMGMSRMNLYRKLQAITGQTPTEFIRTIRLKRAAQLLQDGKLNVSEVADRVGFSSSSYFTKCFKEQFGVLPTQYSETDESGKTDEK